jgi:hypothetical protein
MKSYKEFRRTCPSGYKFDKKLGACVPKGNRHVSVVGRYLGGRQNDDSDDSKKNGSNGNGNGNGGNGNGNGGSGNGGNGGGNGGGGNGGGGGE